MKLIFLFEFQIQQIFNREIFQYFKNEMGNNSGYFQGKAPK